MQNLLIALILFIVIVSVSIFSIIKAISKSKSNKPILYSSAFFIVVSVLIYLVLKYYFAESDSCGLFIFWPLILLIFGIGLCMFLISLINLAYQRIIPRTK
jgi:hypothetical protein